MRIQFKNMALNHAQSTPCKAAFVRKYAKKPHTRLYRRMVRITPAGIVLKYGQ